MSEQHKGPEASPMEPADGSGQPSVMLSIVIPVHNEELNITPLVENIEQVFAADAPVGSKSEIIVVNDGSTDSTAEILDKLTARRLIRVVTHSENRGYGAALCSGFSAARGVYVSVLDGDRQLYPEDLLTLYRAADPTTLHIGYRAPRNDPPHRIVLGKLFSRVFVPLAIGVHVRDVDCALKVIPRKLIVDSPPTASGALISSEVLARANQHGYRLVQHPVRHRQREFGEPTGAKLSVILRVFRELWGLRRRLKASAPGFQPELSARSSAA